jgi:flagellar biogenesis protein FliO
MMPIIQALTSLAATLALLLGCAWAWKRWGSQIAPGFAAGGSLLPAAKRRRMMVQESLRLGPNATLYMVEIDGETHVIAVNAGQTSLLTSVKPAKKGKVHA